MDLVRQAIIVPRVCNTGARRTPTSLRSVFRVRFERVRQLLFDNLRNHVYYVIYILFRRIK